MNNTKDHILWQLFITFLKIGAFTFGGGYAMISLLEEELVGKKGWTTQEEFLDIVAIAESTPGPIAINSATYIGYKKAGVLGALVATVGMCIPSLTVIYVISLFFDRFLELKIVAAAFKGIQVCVVYLIFSAGWKLFKGMKKKPMPIAVFSVALIIFVACTLWAVKISSIWLILAAGVVGLSVGYAGKSASGTTQADKSKGGDRS